jgi:curved DNA-binding protein CbpA
MVLATDDLYQILGLEKTAALDKMSLRRAYLSRSKACHPECVFLPASLVSLIANA